LGFVNLIDIAEPRSSPGLIGSESLYAHPPFKLRFRIALLAPVLLHKSPPSYSLLFADGTA